MKKVICLFVVFILLLYPLGCSKDDSAITLHFYYPRQNYGYDPLEGRFFQQSAQDEIRNDIAYHSARQVIGVYLKGPLDSSLVNPFPKETDLVTLSIEGNTLYVTLSDHFAELTGIPMIMACSCLAKTAMAITNAENVCIKCETALLDGVESVTINTESIIFDDSVGTNTTQEE